jgi:hypothetical protein
MDAVVELKDIVLLLEKLKTDIKNDTEEVIKREINSLNIGELIKEQNIKIENLRKENEELRKHLMEQSRFIDSINRRNNLVFYGIEDQKEESNEVLRKSVLDVCNGVMKVALTEAEVNYVRRMGPATAKKRPIILSCISHNKKMELLTNGRKLKGTRIFVAQDTDRETRDRRKSMMRVRNALQSEGRDVKLRDDGLVVDGKFVQYKHLMNEETISGEIEMQKNETGNSESRSEKGKNVYSQNSMPPRFRGQDAGGPNARISYFFRPRGASTKGPIVELRK